MQFAVQQRSTRVLNPTTESKPAVKQLIRYLKGTQHTCLRIEPARNGSKKVCWNSLDVVSQIGLAIREHTKVLRDIIAMYRMFVTLRNRSLRPTAISLSSCEAEFYAASAFAVELLGLSALFNEFHCNVSVRLEMDSDSP